MINIGLIRKSLLVIVEIRVTKAGHNGKNIAEQVYSCTNDVKVIGE
jgi:hypothetical protein